VSSDVRPSARKPFWLNAVLLQAAGAQSAKATLAAAPASAWDGEWVLTLDQFAPGAVGQKAMSTTNLHKAASAAAACNGNGSALQLPDWVKLPASVALPHGSFEAVLRAPLNRDVSGRLQDLVQHIAKTADRHPGNPDACAAELEEIRWGRGYAMNCFGFVSWTNDACTAGACCYAPPLPLTHRHCVLSLQSQQELIC
jgi:hypothetical protein